MKKQSRRRLATAFAQSRRHRRIFNSLAATWVLRLVLALRPGRHVLRQLCTEEPATFLGIPDIFETWTDETLIPASSRAIRQVLRRRLEQVEPGAQELAETPLGVNIGWLAGRLRLGPAAQKILAYAVLRHALADFGRTLETIDLVCSKDQAFEALACMLDLPVAKIRAALSGNSPLLQSGLVRPAGDCLMPFEDLFSLPDRLVDNLQKTHADADALLASFFQEATPTSLVVDDFPHMADDLALLCSYLSKAQAAGLPGVNILLHGAPGVGKSQFARLVAQGIGHRLYEVACANANGEAIDGQARFTSFMLSQKMLARASGNMVLFDEIEDVFPGSGLLALFEDADDTTAVPGKAWINRVLESNPVPTIWIANHVEQIDPAYLRRFDYTLELPGAPKDVRRRIAEKYLAPLGTTPGFIDRIAACGNLTPAQIGKAARIAGVVADSPAYAEALVERTLKQSARIFGQGLPVKPAGQSPDYGLRYLNTSIATEPLVAALKLRPYGSFCLYGPPGTGKTAFAHHLAEHIGKPLLVKRASDLLSKWVGESEQNIARMFEEAGQGDAVLLLDEADSLLTERRAARQSWELTQVNELLTQMDDFAGIFICTTNLLDRLDPASLRRFAFKIRFDYLTPRQRQELFSAEIKRLQPGAGNIAPGILDRLERLDRLAPGDFAAVARQYWVRPGNPDAEALISALEEECRVKTGGARPIGFTT